MLNERDIAQIGEKGISREDVLHQIENFKNGFPFLSIAGAAVVGDGIVRFSAEEVRRLEKEYDDASASLNAVKFVPASGAATRMFKDLYAFLNEDKESPAVEEVIANLSRFAFYDALTEEVSDIADPKAVVSAILGKPGLGYGKKPKGLILFHTYHGGNRTAAEEHLAEGALYAASGDGVVRIHFTVSPEHKTGFEEVMNQVLGRFEEEYGVRYEISYSFQKPRTDTLAVDMENEPFREGDGSLLFRPAGHGALLQNLNEIDADLVFIKNIDNVVPERFGESTVTYKKVLAAHLLRIREKCYEYARRLESEEAEADLGGIALFVKKELGYKFSPEYVALPEERKKEVLYSILNRPIRVCGMVKNEGEPGGGPFWVNREDGSQSLQIAESSQISPEQMELMRTATHFNPVDLVCSVRDYRGNKFDLREFVDPKTGFISVKSKDGRELKAQELPGLWNGSMAYWNTAFVEVPVSTFNPVKTINDLLRPQHQ